MARYQLRGPDNLTIEDVIEEMAGKGWDAIKDLMDLHHMHAPLKDYRRFQNAVYRSVMPFIRSYRLCGNFPICTKPFTNHKSASDEIYHLFLNEPGDTNTFFGQIAEATIESVDHFLKPERQRQAYDHLRTIFQEVLTEYLSSNPVCGEAEVCKISELSPVQPWFRVLRTSANTADSTY